MDETNMKRQSIEGNLTILYKMSDYNQSYMFNQLGSLKSDTSDATQRTVYNTRFANYMLSNYFSDDQAAPVDFSTKYPTVTINGTFQGPGVPSSSVDNDTKMIMGYELERPWDKLELTPRIFSTVPYLGRGSCDPTLENMIRMGEPTIDRKSVSTVSESSYGEFQTYPGEDLSKEPEQKEALGFLRGGIDSREFFLGQETRPSGWK